MSNRPEITAILSLSIQKHINPHDDTRIYWAREVTFDYATSKSCWVDRGICFSETAIKDWHPLLHKSKII